MDRLDMEEAVAYSPTLFDLLVFVYNGNASGDDETSLVFVIRDTNAVKSITEMSDMEELGFSINGCVQLSREQTHYRDTQMMAPTRFLVSNGNGGWVWLHDVEVWDVEKYRAAKEGDEDDGRDFTPPYEQ